MKKYLLLLVAVLMFTACGGKKEVQKEESAKTVKVEEISIQEIKDQYATNADLDLWDEVNYITTTGGDVKEIYVRNGQEVKKDQVLVLLTDQATESAYYQAEANYINAKSSYEKGQKFAEDQVRNNYIAAEANYISAKKQLEKAERGAKQEELENAEFSVATAKSAYDVAKISFEKSQSLYGEELITEDEYLVQKNKFESAKNSYETAVRNEELLKQGTDEEDLERMRAAEKNALDTYNLQKKLLEDEAWKYDLQSLKSNYLSAKATYETAKKNYSDLTVKAKFDGKVANLDLKKYEKVEKDAVVCSLINNKTMTAKVGIPADYISKVEIGSSVKIYVEALKKEYEGKVYWINPIAKSGTKMFEIKVKFDNNNGELKKGMYSKVTVDAGAHTGILIPQKSIVIKNLYKYIFVVEDNKAKKLRIELGTHNGDYQELISDEVKEGMKIVIEGQFILEDRDTVKEVK